jgi:hypothetical protein
MKHPAFQTLEGYYRQLASLDAKSEVTDYFHLPAVLIVGDQKHLCTTETALETVYSRIVEKYRAEKIAKLTWDDSETSVFQIYPYLVLVKTIMSRQRADGDVVKRWACSYLVREVGSMWKFDVVTAVPN